MPLQAGEAGEGIRSAEERMRELEERKHGMFIKLKRVGGWVLAGAGGRASGRGTCARRSARLPACRAGLVCLGGLCWAAGMWQSASSASVSELNRGCSSPFCRCLAGFG